jgi:hypothetical protein
LFKLVKTGFNYKVIVVNKRCTARKVVAFLEGRGSKEGILPEFKSHCQIDYVPVTSRVGNQLYLFAGILAHILTRGLQIQLTARARGTIAKRDALWCFREIKILRRTLIQRTGSITRPAGKVILSMNVNEKLENELLQSISTLKALAV